MIIVSPARSISKSSEFYYKLGFEIFELKKINYALSKGAIVELNTNAFARPGLKFFVDSINQTKDNLERFDSLHFLENGFILSDPSGIRIYVCNNNYIDFDEISDSHSILGNYSGISLETTDMQKSVEFYSQLGFEKESGSLEGGWISLKDSSGNTLSIMKPNSCPHSFFNPSLTYFNSSKNLEVIEKIRQQKIPIKEEITLLNKEGLVDNVILQDPGGIGFFVFND